MSHTLPVPRRTAARIILFTRCAAANVNGRARNVGFAVSESVGARMRPSSATAAVTSATESGVSCSAPCPIAIGASVADDAPSGTPPPAPVSETVSAASTVAESRNRAAATAASNCSVPNAYPSWAK